MDITRAVLENHLLIPVPNNPSQFSTIAGVEGRFVQNQKGQRFIHLFRARKRADGQHDPLLNPAEEFYEEEVCQAESVTGESKLVFDQSNGTSSNVSVNAHSKGDDLALAILHVSAPLLINGEPWLALRAPPLPTDWVAFSTATFLGRLEMPGGKDVKLMIDQFVKEFTKRPPPEDAQGEAVRSFMATVVAQLEKHTYATFTFMLAYPSTPSQVLVSVRCLRTEDGPKSSRVATIHSARQLTGTYPIGYGARQAHRKAGTPLLGGLCIFQSTRLAPTIGVVRSEAPGHQSKVSQRGVVG